MPTVRRRIDRARALYSESLSFGSLGASNSLRGLDILSASASLRTTLNEASPKSLAPVSHAAIRPRVTPGVLSASCCCVQPRFCLYSLRLMAHLAICSSGPNYTFGLIADGVSDAIAPRSLSGPRTTRKTSALLHYPSPVLDWVSVTLFNSQTLMSLGIALTYHRDFARRWDSNPVPAYRRRCQ